MLPTLLLNHNACTAAAAAVAAASLHAEEKCVQSLVVRALLIVPPLPAMHSVERPCLPRRLLRGAGGNDVIGSCARSGWKCSLSREFVLCRKRVRDNGSDVLFSQETCWGRGRSCDASSCFGFFYSFSPQLVEVVGGMLCI